MLSLGAATVLALCQPSPRDNCIVDGDTFWLDGEKIRIADTNRPDISQPQSATAKALAVCATF